ncbi:hypothetical protein BD410DRAFT_396064 [Rickenella mellea]|uniref:Uncharacterized protein n=1 Tax=Rickenella mellea TaxID=50990 RepID=A0A4Y7PYT4_9AGAM|nr:hypothetical protein BD410DRAFT_396064 [Rickenella mellea]
MVSGQAVVRPLVLLCQWCSRVRPPPPYSLSRPQVIQINGDVGTGKLSASIQIKPAALSSGPVQHEREGAMPIGNVTYGPMLARAAEEEDLSPPCP